LFCGVPVLSYQHKAEKVGSNKNLESNKYNDEDAAMQAVIKALQKSSESLTPREKIHVCMLVTNHIGKI
jgi:hypothetical protein